MYVDLHVHTDVSDGMYSPAQAVHLAARGGVSVLAVCDHDRLAGSAQAALLAQNVRLIPGVEIDALWKGCDLHVLGLDVDLADPVLLRVAQSCRAALEGMSDTLLNRMRACGYPVSATEFHGGCFENGQGGWPALHYLVQKGLAQSWKEAIRFYEEFDVRYGNAPFCGLREVCAAIRGAGGCAILAHPGATPGLEAGPGTGFDRELCELVRAGIQGLECFYPQHDPALTEYFLSLCRERGLYISSGSDCHGPEGPQIGSLRTLPEQLRLPFLQP